MKSYLKIIVCNFASIFSKGTRVNSGHSHATHLDEYFLHILTQQNAFLTYVSIKVQNMQISGHDLKVFIRIYTNISIDFTLKYCELLR